MAGTFIIKRAGYFLLTEDTSLPAVGSSTWLSSSPMLVTTSSASCLVWAARTLWTSNFWLCRWVVWERSDFLSHATSRFVTEHFRSLQILLDSALSLWTFRQTSLVVWHSPKCQPRPFHFILFPRWRLSLFQMFSTSRFWLFVFCWCRHYSLMLTSQPTRSGSVPINIAFSK